MAVVICDRFWEQPFVKSLNPTIFENLDKAPGLFMGKYEGKPEFEESFFTVI